MWCILLHIITIRSKCNVHVLGRSPNQDIIGSCPMQYSKYAGKHAHKYCPKKRHYMHAPVGKQGRCIHTPPSHHVQVCAPS